MWHSSVENWEGSLAIFPFFLLFTTRTARVPFSGLGAGGWISCWTALFDANERKFTRTRINFRLGARLFSAKVPDLYWFVHDEKEEHGGGSVLPTLVTCDPLRGWYRKGTSRRQPTRHDMTTLGDAAIDCTLNPQQAPSTRALSVLPMGWGGGG